ncbi:MAG: hypothetical protein RR053_01305 [Evtepia sp.]
MNEKIMPGPVQDNCGIREAVCIHTRKIFDSCRDKDCIEDLKFYPTQSSQNIIDRALSIKAGKAELLYVYTDVESAGFNRGFYSVDIRYYYRITAEAFVGAARPVEICGLSVFDKRVLLFGSEASAKIFTSEENEMDECAIRKSNLPIAVVEGVDPIVLNMKLVDSGDCHCCDCNPCSNNNNCGACAPTCEYTEVPPCICACFGCDLNFGNDRKRVCVTLGQFSIVRLERDTQLLIPVYDYCLPNKECSGGNNNNCEDDPCEMFRQVKFPVDEFFPPNASCRDDCREMKINCC